MQRKTKTKNKTTTLGIYKNLKKHKKQPENTTNSHKT